MQQLEAERADEARREELRSSLKAVRARISAAVSASGRTEAPQLIVVTKYFPASDVLALTELGVSDVGENREQEAGPKAHAVAEAGAHPRWHFIGQLQSNKASRVLRFASEVHSVDRGSLVSALDRATRRRAEEAESSGAPTPEPLGCYLQVDLRDAADRQAAAGPSRGGAGPADLARLADQVAATPWLALRGLMAVAPLGEEPRAAFDRLAALSSVLTADHPEAGEISAGMSSDLEAAVAAGATRLRIGSDVLGRRPALG